MTDLLSPNRTTPGLARRLLSLYSSSVGRKFVMALSGIAIVGFVIAHLVGTLKIFLGPSETNEYGEALRSLGGHLVPHGHVLWVLRLGLLLAFVVHLHAAFTLDRRNRASRGAAPVGRREHLVATYASRTMLQSGIVVALFIVFHLADLTWGATNSEFVRDDPYGNQIASFRNPLINSIYLAGVGAMTMHLHHGLWSLFQSLGLRVGMVDERTHRKSAAFAATAIGVGYASIPVAVVTGLLTESGVFWP